MRDKARDEAIAAAFLGGETMTAIGQHYGISRERVRQLLVRQGVTWDTRGGGFTTLDPTDRRFRYGWSRAGFCWWRAHHRHKATRREHLAKVRAYVAETGDTFPSTPTVLTLLGVASIARLAQIWGMPQKKRNHYAKTLNRFRKLAGITARPRGYWGHDATA